LLLKGYSRPESNWRPSVSPPESITALIGCPGVCSQDSRPMMIDLYTTGVSVAGRSRTPSCWSQASKRTGSLPQLRAEDRNRTGVLQVSLGGRYTGTSLRVPRYRLGARPACASPALFPGSWGSLSGFNIPHEGVSSRCPGPRRWFRTNPLFLLMRRVASLPFLAGCQLLTALTLRGALVTHLRAVHGAGPARIITGAGFGPAISGL
jgi:hypothetical protein